MQVNRYLKDKAMDRIDHALGRPVDPMAEGYRNYFATHEGQIADSFRASPNWQHDGARGSMLYFSVTSAGRRALHDHLREIGDLHRQFAVEWAGLELSVVATTRGKAKYLAYLGASDCDPDLTFKQFCAEARVRLA